MQLGQAVDIMKQLDEYIRVNRRAMLHMNSLSVDAVRHYVNELEDIRETLYNQPIVAARNLDNLLEKYRDCVRDCLHPFYRHKGQDLETPIPDKWVEELPVTVTAINLIVYLDISDSMFDWGGFQVGGTKRKLIQDFANKIKTRAQAENVPMSVSLVAYADPTDSRGLNRPTFWEIVLNKSANVGDLANKISSINKTKWVNGLSQLEEGITCIYKTIDSVYDGRVVNGKKTENIVLLISDERQRCSTYTSSHKNYPYTVSASAITNKLKGLGIKNFFALLPFDKGYNYVGYDVSRSRPVIGGKGWNRGLRALFRSTKEYWDTTNLTHLDNWVRWILDPDSFGT